MTVDVVSQLRDQLRAERAMRQKLESEHNRMVKAQMESAKEIQVLTQLSLEQQHSIKILQARIQEMDRHEVHLRRQVVEAQSEAKRAKAADHVPKRDSGGLQAERARRRQLEALCRQYEAELEAYRGEAGRGGRGSGRQYETVASDEYPGPRYMLQDLGPHHGSDPGSPQRSSPSHFHSRRDLDDEYDYRAPPSTHRPTVGGAGSGRRSPQSPFSSQSARSNRSGLSARRPATQRSRSYDRPTPAPTPQPRPRPATPEVHPQTPISQQISPVSGRPRATPILQRHEGSPARSSPVHPSLSSRSSPSRRTLSPQRSGRTTHRGPNALDPRSRSRSSERAGPGDVISTSRMLDELTPKKRF
eukprot:EG_transcript_11107